MELIPAGKDKSALSTGRPKPTLVAGEKKGEFYISTGRYSGPPMAEYLLAHARDKFVPFGTLARVAYRRNCLETKNKIRSYYRGLADYMEKEHGVFLILSEDAKHGTCVKIMDASHSEDCQIFLDDLKRRHSRNEITSERFARAYAMQERMRSNAFDPNLV